MNDRVWLMGLEVKLSVWPLFCLLLRVVTYFIFALEMADQTFWYHDGV